MSDDGATAEAAGPADTSLKLTLKGGAPAAEATDSASEGAAASAAPASIGATDHPPAAGEPTASGGSASSAAAADSEDDDAAATEAASPKKRQNRVAISDEDSDDNDDDTALAMVDDEPAAAAEDDDEEPATAGGQDDTGDKPASSMQTSDMLQQLFGDGSDDDDCDEGGFDGFDRTEYEQAPEPAPAPAKKSKKSASAAAKNDKKRRARDDGDEPDSSAPVSDFDQMMAARRAKNNRKRRKKDSEGVGDAAVEAAVAKVLEVMEKAHKEDEDAVRNKKPATRKLKVLKSVVQALNNATYTEEFIERNVFAPLAKWLSPNPETGMLPNGHIRNALIKILHDSFIRVTLDDIRASRIGKILMMLKESKQETRANKAMLETIIKAWSSQIWGVVADQSEVAATDRQHHYHRLAQASTRRRSSVGDVEVQDEVRKPGTKGFVMRARVPIVLPRDYAHRPVSKISMEEAEAKVDHNQTQLKTMKSAFKDKLARASKGQQHARGINISGSVSGKGQ